MTTGSPRKNTSPLEDVGPLLGGMIIVACLLAAFPAWVIGFCAQRSLERVLCSWRLRLLIWLILGLLAGYSLYTHSVADLYTRELTDYVHVALLHQYDFAHWPWKVLWADTWPVWLPTLWAVPIAGLVHDVFSQGGTGQTARHLLWNWRRPAKRSTNDKKRPMARRRNLLMLWRESLLLLRHRLRRRKAPARAMGRRSHLVGIRQNSNHHRRRSHQKRRMCL